MDRPKMQYQRSLITTVTTSGLYAEILQRGGELGVLKKEGGAAASSVRGSTGRQCLKITLRLLLLAGTNFSVLVLCCIWQVFILAFLMIRYVFLIDYE